MLSKLNTIIAEFAKAGISSPRLEANMLINAAKNDDELNSFVKQRLEHKPICKIIGNKGFYKYNFKVDENVLSPRPDTETLVEQAISIINKNNDIVDILELGIGSGCIILSLLLEFVKIHGVGVDISSKALSIAEENAKILNVINRLKLVNKSWFDDDLAESLKQTFDIIVSNPPYIRTKDIAILDNDVKNYDPILALDGGEDGLRDYHQISEISLHLLKNNGYILLEVGINQSEDVAKIFIKKGFKLIDIVKDLSGIDRCIILKK